MRFRVMLKLAARSVGRNARRSALTAAAMVIGLALLIFSRSLAEGAHEQWITSAIRIGSGHVAIQTVKAGVAHTVAEPAIQGSFAVIQGNLRLAKPVYAFSSLCPQTNILFVIHYYLPAKYLAV